MANSTSGVKAGNGTRVGWLALIDLYIIWICTSIAGLAIAPVMPTLMKVFPGTTELETQMLTVAPNIAAIPFTLLGGALATKWNNMKMLYWSCIVYVIAAACFLFAPSMIWVIILSFVIGITAGMLSPLASVFVADMFYGSSRQQQYGNASAMVNVGLMIGVIATGYLAKVDWRLPFMMYLLPLFPLFFSGTLKKYIKEPADRHKATASIGGDKTPAPAKSVSYWQSVNHWALIRYCLYYFLITMVIGTLSNYIAYLPKVSSVEAGYLQAVLFFGIMISGFLLNWVMRWLKHGTYIVMTIAIAAGFLLIFITDISVIIGIGIFIACFFYGIAQPYVENKVVAISTPAAAVISLSVYSVMDSIGNVVNPFFFKYVGLLFGHEPLPGSNQEFPFICSMILMLILTVAIAVYKIIVGIRSREGHPVNNLPPIYQEAMKNGTYDQLLAAQHGITPSAPVALTPLQQADLAVEAVKKELSDTAAQTAKRIADEEAKLSGIEQDIYTAEMNEASAANKAKAAADLAAADAKTASEHARQAADAAASADAISQPRTAAQEVAAQQAREAAAQKLAAEEKAKIQEAVAAQAKAKAQEAEDAAEKAKAAADKAAADAKAAADKAADAGKAAAGDKPENSK